MRGFGFDCPSGTIADMDDWTDCDISRISDAEFPVCCDECGHVLAGSDDRGECPACSAVFSRRELLWRTHGPEAFADRPHDTATGITVPSGAAPGASGDDRSFTRVMSHAIIMAVSLPGLACMWFAVFGSVDLTVFTPLWLLLVAMIEWTLYSWPLDGDD